MRIQIGACLALGLAVAAGTAQAQTSRTLADGRTVSATTTVANCRPGTVVADNPTGVHLRFNCRVPSFDAAADTDGGGDILILARAGAQTPVDFLTSEAVRWWPDFPTWPQDQRDNLLTRTEKTLATGSAPFLCLYRDNIDALDGDAVCVLATPGMQVVATGKSSMALTADNVVDAMLAGVSLR